MRKDQKSGRKDKEISGFNLMSIRSKASFLKNQVISQLGPSPSVREEESDSLQSGLCRLVKLAVMNAPGGVTENDMKTYLH